MKLSANTDIGFLSYSMPSLCIIYIKKLTLELNIKSGLLQIIGESERAINKREESNIYIH